MAVYYFIVIIFLKIGTSHSLKYDSVAGADKG